MIANELKELLELRRKAKDAEEKEIIDRAIDTLLNERTRQPKPDVPPIYIGSDDPSKWDVPYIQRWKPMCLYDPDRGPTDTGALAFTNDPVNRQCWIVGNTKSAAEADADNISILLQW